MVNRILFGLLIGCIVFAIASTDIEGGKGGSPALQLAYVHNNISSKKNPHYSSGQASERIHHEESGSTVNSRPKRYSFDFLGIGANIARQDRARAQGKARIVGENKAEASSAGSKVAQRLG